MEIIKLKIDEIIPYENNVKLHPREQVEQIKNSILEFGNNDPIAIDENNVIIEGHGRHMALEELGYEEVECIRIEGLNEEQKAAYRLVHNKLTMNSDFDMDGLEEELRKIKELNMFDFGFDVEPETEEDEFNVEEELEKIEEPESKLGEIYQLGEHRLMVGDSTSIDDVNKLMNGELADCLMTDPPYNVAVSNSQGMTIENDNMSSSEFNAFINSAMNCASNALKEGAAFYVWYGDIEDVAFRTAVKNNNLLLKQCLIWVKSQFTLGRQDYQWAHEPCLYGWKEGAAHYFADDRAQSTVIEDKPNINKMSKQELKDYVKELLEGTMSTTVIREDKPTVNSDHPTMKPIKLLARLIKNSTKQKQLVLDLFGESGSTLITCEQLNRKCYMMEYDPKYADVIIKRWEKQTGQKAVKINEK